GLEISDIDYLIFATMTPDCYLPGAGAFLQRKLELGNIPCLDIRQQCAGFIYSLQLADALIRSGQYRNVLIVGAEVHTCLLPWSKNTWRVIFGQDDCEITPDEFAKNTESRDRTVLFGDGAGAAVISACEDEGHGIVDSLIHADGNEAERLIARAGGSNYRPYFDQSMVESGDITPMVEGREVYRLATRYMPKVAREILERNDMGVEDVDLLIAHQANLRINEAVQKRLGLPDEKVYNNVQRYGNTTAATIPIALHEVREKSLIKDGDLVAFVGLGSGLNWGAVLYRV
ncbi:MAG: 3-oxoacyl-ACP synthase, partial [bacterium]|nr:3-oxoacyl-ACP synthase [bacterium]